MVTLTGNELCLIYSILTYVIYTLILKVENEYVQIPENQIHCQINVMYDDPFSVHLKRTNIFNDIDGIWAFTTKLVYYFCMA